MQNVANYEGNWMALDECFFHQFKGGVNGISGDNYALSQEQLKYMVDAAKIILAKAQMKAYLYDYCMSRNAFVDCEDPVLQSSGVDCNVYNEE
jgi:hypothetical protein